ncbi:lipopolysaccharide biosynthesis protein [Geminicoccus flavidas]|uniref:lipopolysaccharide biosynthesis protein n=1 Tax=Geminicoccus flavidas TaxID=2506407 RepID=UPI00135BA1DD|nr:hypothetical protein [Geminicoccus flavidas]
MARKVNAICSALAVGSSAAGQWLLLIGISKAYGPYWAGVYALGWAILFPMYRLASLSLREIFSSNYAIKEPGVAALQVRGLTSLAAGLASLAILVAISPEAVWFFTLMTLWRFIESIFDFAAGLYQREDRYISLATSALIRNIALPLAFTLLLLRGSELYSTFTIFVLADLVLLAALDLRRIIRLISPAEPGFWPFLTRHLAQLDWAAVWSIITFALPAGLAVFFASLTTSVPRVVTELQLGKHEVGVLAVTTQLTYAAVPLLVALCQALMPSLGRAVRDNQFGVFRRDSALLVLSALACGAAVMIWALTPLRESLVILLFSQEFVVDRTTSAVLALSAVFAHLNVVLGPIALAKQRYRREATQNVAVFVFAVALSWLGGIMFGFLGIVGAVCVVQLCRSLSLCIWYAGLLRHRNLQLS